MKLNEQTVDAAANKIALRWGLTLNDRVAETRRAYVFKADGPDGLAAFKLYKRLGSAGEGAAVRFLRNLGPEVGVEIHRSSAWQAAVLMEWLEGPTLDELVAEGQDARAISLLAEAAHAVSTTNFRFRFIYRRIVPGLKKDFKTHLSEQNSSPYEDAFQRAAVLLDHLAQTTTKERVIHGDLGFSNVILSPKGPRVIDPKGLRVDPAFELAKALVAPYNNLTISDFIKRINSRGPVFAEALDTTQLRLIQWAAVIIAHTTIHQMKRNEKELRSLPYLTTLLDMSKE